MRGHYEEDPIEVAVRRLERQAIKYAAQYMLDGWGEDAKRAADSLRAAAVQYAEATAPKKRRSTHATPKDGGKSP